MRIHVLLTLVVIASLGLQEPAQCENFPQFRGATGDGRVAAQRIPLEWSEDQNLAWKIPMEGSGWSSPIVWDQKIYLTSAFSEDLGKPKGFGEGARSPQSMLGGLALAPRTEIQWRAQCISTQDGKVLWQKTLATGRAPFAKHPSNTYATESVVVDEQGVYVWFASIGKLFALTHAGEPRWNKEYVPHKMSNGFGTGSSPAIFQGKLYLQNFSEQTAELICLDTATGDEVWKYTRPKNGSAWCTPVVWTNAIRSELIVSEGNQLDSLDPLSGDVLWTVSNVKAATACSVGADDRQLYFGSSDPFAKGPLFAVQPGASGDVSPHRKNTQFQSCVWLQDKGGASMASPVSNGKYVYIVDKNILRCYDATNGERVYQNRVPNLGMVAASPLAIGDMILLLDESGSAALVASGAEFKLLGSGKLDDTFWSTPSVADGAIYLRGVDSLYCVRAK